MIFEFAEPEDRAAGLEPAARCVRAQAAMVGLRARRSRTQRAIPCRKPTSARPPSGCADIVERLTFHNPTGWSVLQVSPFGAPQTRVSVLVHQAHVVALRSRSRTPQGGNDLVFGEPASSRSRLPLGVRLLRRP